jgi:zinc transporter ZupT
MSVQPEEEQDLLVLAVESSKSAAEQGKFGSAFLLGGTVAPSHIIACLLIAAVTWGSRNDLDSSTTTVWTVWWYGWLTCLSTGLGALPFACAQELPPFVVGAANAVAAGMMISASANMMYEAWSLPDDEMAATGLESVGSEWRMLGGLLVGFAFIRMTTTCVDDSENTHFENLQGLDAKKALVIFMVMFLHSLAEGIGIGVSFGSSAPPHLGLLVTMSLAVHNIPEGLAISLVMIPKGVPVFQAALWSIFSSLGQPVLALPAFAFVESFLPWVPVGLGFAAGAMIYVAIFELLKDALESDATPTTIAVTTFTSMAAMGALQWLLKEGLEGIR